MTPEGKVKKAIKEYLDSLGSDCWYFMPVMNGYGRAGIPDFIGCYNGKFFAIEAKAPSKEYTLTPWQKKEIDAITEAGGVAAVVMDVHAMPAVMDEVHG